MSGLSVALHLRPTENHLAGPEVRFHRVDWPYDEVIQASTLPCFK